MLGVRRATHIASSRRASARSMGSVNGLEEGGAVERMERLCWRHRVSMAWAAPPGTPTPMKEPSRAEVFEWAVMCTRCRRINS